MHRRGGQKADPARQGRGQTGAQHARMRIAVMAKRQQQKFELERLQARRTSAGAGENGDRFAGDASQHRGDLALVRPLPQIEKTAAFQFAQEQGARSRPGDADGITPRNIDFQNERVGQNEDLTQGRTGRSGNFFSPALLIRQGLLRI